MTRKAGLKGCAVKIDHREGPYFLTDRVDDQSVALIIAYGLTPPGGRRVLGMGHIHSNMANFVIAEINQDHLVLLLYDLHALLVVQRVRGRLRPALVTGVGGDHAA